MEVVIWVWVMAPASKLGRLTMSRSLLCSCSVGKYKTGLTHSHGMLASLHHLLLWRSASDQNHETIATWLALGSIPVSGAQWMMMVRLQAFFKSSDVLVKPDGSTATGLLHGGTNPSSHRVESLQHGSHNCQAQVTMTSLAV